MDRIRYYILGHLATADVKEFLFVRRHYVCNGELKKYAVYYIDTDNKMTAQAIGELDTWVEYDGKRYCGIGDFDALCAVLERKNVADMLEKM